MPPRCRWAPMRSPRRSPRKPRSATARSRSSATARAACCGWSRWSKSRRANGRVAYGPVKPADVAEPLQGRFPQRRDAQALARPHRRDPVLQEPGAPDVRALRHHRSAVDRGLSRPRRLRRPDQRADHGAARHRHRSDDVRPARPRRRRLPDRHQVEDRPRRQGRSEIHLLQRRRRRQRHLRRSHADGRRSVSASSRA